MYLAWCCLVLTQAVDPPVDGNTTDAPWDDGVPMNDEAPVEAVRCGYDEKVEAGLCVPCGYGTVNEPGADPTGGDTNCTNARSFVFGLRITNSTSHGPPAVFDPSGAQASLMAYFLTRHPTVRNLTFVQICTYPPGVDESGVGYPGPAEQCEFVQGEGSSAVECEGTWCEYVLWSTVVTSDKTKLTHILTDPGVDWEALGVYGEVQFVKLEEVSAGVTGVVEVTLGKNSQLGVESIFRRLVAVEVGVQVGQVVVYKFDTVTWFQIVGVDAFLAVAIEDALKAHFADTTARLTEFFEATSFRITDPSTLTTTSSEKSTPIWATVLLAVSASLVCIGVIGAVAMTVTIPCPCLYSEEDKVEAAEKRIRDTRYRTTMV